MLNFQIRLLIIALRTWSRFPFSDRLPASVEPPSEWLARSTRYAPLVGLLVAIPTALAYALAGLWLPHPVALLAALATGMLLTGSMHERAFAALCDGLGAHFDPRRARAAMRNGNRGSMATLGLVMLMLAKFETLSSIDPTWIGVCLVCAAAISRGCAVLVMSTLSPALSDDARAPAAPNGLDLGIASACAVMPLLAATMWTGDAGVFMTGGGLAVIAALVVRRLAARRLEGHTRECFGGVQQFAELAFHVGVLATLAIVDETPADSAS